MAYICIYDEKKIIASRNDIIGYEIIYDKEKVLNENYVAKPDLISLECDIEVFSKELQLLFEKNMNNSTPVKTFFSKKSINSKGTNKQNNPVKLLNSIAHSAISHTTIFTLLSPLFSFVTTICRSIFSFSSFT